MIHKYSNKDIQFIKDNYKTKGNLEIGKYIFRSADSVKDKMLRLNLKRTDKEVLNLKKKYNKGQFKKDHKPHNTKYNGHERINKEGYVEIRLSERNYRLKHLHVWEKVNGNVPKGYCLKFIDGNKLNININNIKLMTRAENMLNNSVHDYPKEIIPSLIILKKLNNKINTITNGQK